MHDEIDLPFGEVRTRLGGGLAGHNGLKSLKRELGGADFQRVRVGVGRPDSTDPDIVAGYVLGRFAEPGAEVRGAVVERAADEAERLVELPRDEADAARRSRRRPQRTVGQRLDPAMKPRLLLRMSSRVSRVRSRFSLISLPSSTTTTGSPSSSGRTRGNRKLDV